MIIKRKAIEPNIEYYRFTRARFL